ncbi:transposase [Psychrobacillus sp. NPDC093180]|uniref:transposase n=1 Tax=Psychrobacillus sp. NPDC093180 TaxID=3364489 RepID=UPI00382A8F6F
MREEDIPKDSDDQRGREHNEAIQKTMNKVKEVKDLQKKGYSIRKIADETGYTKRTIKNYLSTNFNPVHGQYGVQRTGKLSPFRNEVVALRSKGTTYKEIYTYICIKGYTGTEAAIRQFIAKEKRLQSDLEDEITDGPTEIVARKWLVKLLYKPLNKVKAISLEQVKNVVQKYPLVGTLLRLVWRFKEILQSGDKELLHAWVSEAAALDLNELTSFLNGIKKDIDAVENACTLPYNNGLAEGSVNKLKTIKRIMYGRNSFELLRNKLLLLESRKFN